MHLSLVFMVYRWYLKKKKKVSAAPHYPGMMIILEPTLGFCWSEKYIIHLFIEHSADKQL